MSVYLKSGSATTRRGRKPASVETSTETTNEGAGSSELAAPPKEASVPKTKGSFRGKLSHTSPILDSGSREKKITVYFASLKPEDSSKVEDAEIEKEVGQVAKSLALQRVFGKAKSKPFC